MRKLISLLSVTAALLGGCATAPAPSTPPPVVPQPPAPTPTLAPRVASSGGVSPHETIGTVIGDRRTGNRVTITYGRPFSKNPKTGEMRKIWGGLVPWGKADRLGSDEATLLLTQQPLVIGAATIPAGAYTLYTVPSENGVSKLAFSTNIGKWGVPVDEKHDLVRVDMVKSALEKPVDQLTLEIAKDAAPDSGVIKIMWETTQFSVPFTVKK